MDGENKDRMIDFIDLPQVYRDFENYSFLRPMRKCLSRLLTNYLRKNDSSVREPHENDNKLSNFVNNDKDSESVILVEETSFVDDPKNHTDSHQANSDYFVDLPVQSETEASFGGYKSRFSIGEIVFVEARTFPGMNKLGGVGNIVKITFREEEDDYIYSVKYFVETGTETGIEEKYIHSHSFDSIQPRKESIRGRCNGCNCFISECICESIEPPKSVKRIHNISMNRPTINESNKRYKSSKDSSNPDYWNHEDIQSSTPNTIVSHSNNRLVEHHQIEENEVETLRHDTMSKVENFIKPLKNNSFENEHPNKTYSVKSVGDEILWKVISECRSVNSCTSSLAKIAFIRGDQRNATFIQGEGTINANSLPKDLRETLFDDVAKLDTVKDFISSLESISSFLKGQKTTYMSYEDKRKRLSVEINDLPEELIDDSTKAKYLANKLVNLAYNFELERLISARVGTDLMKVIERKLPKRKHNSELSSEFRCFDKLKQDIEDLMDYLTDIERKVKQEVKDLFNDFEDVFNIHPYDTVTDSNTLIDNRAASAVTSGSSTEETLFSTVRNRKSNNPTKFIEIDINPRKFTTSKRKQSNDDDRGWGKSNSIIKSQKAFTEKPHSNRKRSNDSNDTSSHNPLENRYKKLSEKMSNMATKKSSKKLMSYLNQDDNEECRFRIKYMNDRLVAVDTCHKREIDVSASNIVSETTSHQRNDFKSTSTNDSEIKSNETFSRSTHHHEHDDVSLVDDFLSNLSGMELLKVTWNSAPIVDQICHSFTLTSEHNHIYEERTFLTDIRSIFVQVTRKFQDFSILVRSNASRKISHEIFNQLLSTIEPVIASFRLLSTSLKNTNMMELNDCLEIIKREWSLFIDEAIMYCGGGDSSISKYIANKLSSNLDRFIACVFFDLHLQLLIILNEVIRDFHSKNSEVYPSESRVFLATIMDILQSVCYQLYEMSFYEERLLQFTLLSLQSDIINSCIYVASNGWSIDEIAFRKMFNPNEMLGNFSCSTAWLVLIVIVTNMAVDCNVSMEKITNPKLKSFDSCVWKIFLAVLAMIYSNYRGKIDYAIGQSSSLYLSVFTDISTIRGHFSDEITESKGSIDMKREGKMTQDFIWTMIALHSYAIKHYNVIVRKLTVPNLGHQCEKCHTNNWMYVNVFVSSVCLNALNDMIPRTDISNADSLAMIGLVSSRKVKTNITSIMIQLKRVKSLISCWTDNRKGLETFLEIIELIFTHEALKTTLNKDFKLIYPSRNGNSINLEQMFYRFCIGNDERSENDYLKLLELIDQYIATECSFSLSISSFINIASSQHNNNNSPFTNKKSIEVFFIQLSQYLSDVLNGIIETKISLSSDFSDRQRNVRSAKLLLTVCVTKLIKNCKCIFQFIMILVMLSSAMNVNADIILDDSSSKTSGDANNNAKSIINQSIVKKLLSFQEVDVHEPSAANQIRQKGILLIVYAFLFGPFKLLSQSIIPVEYDSSTIPWSKLSDLEKLGNGLLNFIASSTALTMDRTSDNTSQHHFNSKNDIIIIACLSRSFLRELVMYHKYLRNALKVTSHDIAQGLSVHLLSNQTLIISFVHVSLIAVIALQSMIPSYDQIAMNEESYVFDASIFLYCECLETLVYLVDYLNCHPKSSIPSNPMTPPLRKLIETLFTNCRSLSMSARTIMKTVKDDRSWSISFHIVSNDINISTEQRKRILIEKTMKSIASMVYLEFVTHELGIIPIKEQINRFVGKAIDEIMIMLSLPPAIVSSSMCANVSDIVLKGQFCKQLIDQKLSMEANSLIIASWKMNVFAHVFKPLCMSWLSEIIIQDMNETTQNYMRHCKPSFESILSLLSTCKSNQTLFQDARIGIWYDIASSCELIERDIHCYDIVSRLVHLRRSLKRLDLSVSSNSESRVNDVIITQLSHLHPNMRLQIFKELSDDFTNHFVRVLNNEKYQRSKNPNNQTKSITNSQYKLYCLMISYTSELNRDKTGQVYHDTLHGMILSQIKDSMRSFGFETLKETLSLNESTKQYQAMNNLMNMLPWVVRSISTTAFTTTCSEWSSLLCVSIVKAMFRYRSIIDNSQYQSTLIMFAFSICVRPTVSMKHIRTMISQYSMNAKLFDSSYWSMILDSLSAIINCTEIDNTSYIPHTYVYNESISELRKHITQGDDNNGQSSCWNGAISALIPLLDINADRGRVKDHNNNKYLLSDDCFTDRKELNLIAIGVRVNISIRCYYLQKKLRAIDTAFDYDDMNRPIHKEYIGEEIGWIDEMTVLVYTMISIAQLFRYFLGDQVNQIDSSMIFILNQYSNDINHRYNDSKNYYFIHERLLHLLMILETCETIDNQNDANKDTPNRIVLSNIETVIEVVSSTIHSGSMDSIFYSTHIQTGLSILLNSIIIINVYCDSIDSNQNRNMNNIRCLVNELQEQAGFIQSKLQRQSESNANNIIKCRVQEILKSSFNCGSNCIDHMLSKIIKLCSIRPKSS